MRILRVAILIVIAASALTLRPVRAQQLNAARAYGCATMTAKLVRPV